MKEAVVYPHYLICFKKALMSMNTKIVLDNIKKRRKALGLTQKDVANRLFMDERNYSKIERGCKKSIDLSLIFSLSEILETSIVTLLTEDQKETMEENASNETMLSIMFNVLSKVSDQQQQLANEMKTIQSKLKMDLPPLSDKRNALDSKN
jgi:transcriptional regulator with XRE-family HTH domain